MRKFACVLTAILAAVPMLCAQGQVATVTSTAPFQLRGANVTTDQGVPSWPVMPGDAIKAGSAPVIITYADGSSIILDPGWWTTGHTVLVLGGTAAAAGLGFGISSAINGGDPISPSP